jgi:glutamate synthase (NADPH/NADH)
MFMSLKCAIGPETNILEPSAQQCQRLFLDHPILCLNDMSIIKSICFKDLKVINFNYQFYENNYY